MVHTHTHIIHIHASNRIESNNRRYNIYSIGMTWILVCTCIRWISGTQHKEYRWSIESHSRVPKAVKEIVLTMTMIRSIASWSSISLLPNELLFLILEQIDFDAIVRVARERSQQQQRQQPPPSRDGEKGSKCLMM